MRGYSNEYVNGVELIMLKMDGRDIGKFWHAGEGGENPGDSENWMITVGDYAPVTPKQFTSRAAAENALEV